MEEFCGHLPALDVLSPAIPLQREVILQEDQPAKTKIMQARHVKKKMQVLGLGPALGPRKHILQFSLISFRRQTLITKEGWCRIHVIKIIICSCPERGAPVSSGLLKKAKQREVFCPLLTLPPCCGPAGTSPGPGCHGISPCIPAAPVLQAAGLREAAFQPGQAFWKQLPPPGTTHRPLSVPRSNLFSFGIPAKPT